MNEFNTDVTIHATKAFNKILHAVKNSSLNDQLQLTFSAMISLKKTQVKDKKGFPLINSTSFPDEDFDSFQIKYDQLLVDLRRSENFKTLNFIPFRTGNIVYMSNESEKHNFLCIGPHLGMPI